MRVYLPRYTFTKNANAIQNVKRKNSEKQATMQIKKPRLAAVDEHMRPLASALPALAHTCQAPLAAVPCPAAKDEYKGPSASALLAPALTRQAPLAAVDKAGNRRKRKQKLQTTTSKRRKATPATRSKNSHNRRACYKKRYYAYRKGIKTHLTKVHHTKLLLEATTTKETPL